MSFLCLLLSSSITDVCHAQSLLQHFICKTGLLVVPTSRGHGRIGHMNTWGQALLHTVHVSTDPSVPGCQPVTARDRERREDRVRDWLGMLWKERSKAWPAIPAFPSGIWVKKLDRKRNHMARNHSMTLDWNPEDLTHSLSLLPLQTCF